MPELTDTARLNWLAERPERLREVYWRLENEGESLREAIDALIRLQIIATWIPLPDTCREDAPQVHEAIDARLRSMLGDLTL